MMIVASHNGRRHSETFPWSDHTLLKSVNLGSIIMTYVALPCVVSTVMKDLSDPVFLEKLKSKGITVKQQVCLLIFFVFIHCMCIIS